MTAGQLIDGGYSSPASVYGLEIAQDQHISALEERGSKIQHVTVKQNTRIMSVI